MAESLTGGGLSVRFAAADDSSSWYRGAVVSYSRAVKHHVLGVPRGPVVSESAAASMAEGVCRLLDADLSLAVTGAGGPDPQDGRPPGTVCMAVHDRSQGVTHTRLVHFDGDAEQVVQSTCDEAVRWLLALRASSDGDRRDQPAADPPCPEAGTKLNLPSASSTPSAISSSRP